MLMGASLNGTGRRVNRDAWSVRSVLTGLTRLTGFEGEGLTIRDASFFTGELARYNGEKGRGFTVFE